MSVDSPPSDPRIPVPGSAAPAAAAAHPHFDPTLLVPWEPRMLVVDDDELCQRAVQLRLEKLGMAIDVADDGRQALDRSATWPYVAVFMDCGLPAIDGYRAAREIRSRDGASQHALIIAVTSHPRHVCLAAGMDHHIAKPVRLDDLTTDCTRLGLLAPDEERVAVAGERGPLLDDAISDSGRSHAEIAVRFLRRTRREFPQLWRAINSKDGSTLSRLAGEGRDRANAAGAPHVAELFERLVAASDRRQFTVAAGLEHALRGALVETAAAIMPGADGAARPAASVAPAAPAAPAAGSVTEIPVVAPVAATPIAPPAPVRVAIADDDPFARAAIAAILERADGIELVAVAEGVAEIVTAVDSTRPDLVVVDWMMPGGGGAAAARKIIELWPTTRIVALTAANGPEAYLEMLRAGASGLVVKGTPPAKLTEMILTVARRPIAVAAAAAPEPGQSAQPGLAAA